MTAESEDFRKHCAEKALYSLFVTMKLDQHDPELGPTVKQIRADTTDAFNNGLVNSYLRESPNACARRALSGDLTPANAVYAVWFDDTVERDPVPFRVLWIGGPTPNATTGKIVAFFVPSESDAKKHAADLRGPTH